MKSLLGDLAIVTKTKRNAIWSNQQSVILLHEWRRTLVTAKNSLNHLDQYLCFRCKFCLINSTQRDWIKLQLIGFPEFVTVYEGGFDNATGVRSIIAIG